MPQTQRFRQPKYKRSGYKTHKKFNTGNTLYKGLSSKTPRYLFKRTFQRQATLDRALAVSDANTGFNTWFYANNNFTPASEGYFTLNALPDYTDFTTLYDTYKICAVKMKFIWSHNSSDVANENKGVCYLLTVNDVDDGTPAASVNEMLQYSSYKTSSLVKPVKRYVKPCKLIQMYETAVSTGYTPTRKGYLDCADNAVPHYGIKWAVQEPVRRTESYEGIAGFVTIQCTYYLSFKTPR